MRQALQYGIDNNSIDSALFKGYAKAITGPIPTVPKTKFLDPNLPNYYPYNPAKGKQLLEAHGWKEVNGVMTKGSQKLNFTFVFVSGSTVTQDVAELMKQDWAQEGIQVTLKPMNFSNYISMISNPKDNSWQLGSGSGWIYDGPGFYPSGETLFQTGTPNGTGFSDPKEDALIQATLQPYPTEQETMQKFFAWEDYTAKVLPFLWGQNVATIGVNSNNVMNAENNNYMHPATGYPQMQYLWIKH